MHGGQLRVAILVMLAMAFPHVSAAVPVDHDSPSGIAAVEMLHGITFPGAGWAKKGEAAIVVLGTDGRIYYSAWNRHQVDFMRKWESLGVDWPVPFDEVVEWTPTPEMLIWRRGDFGHGGVIKTSGGETWAYALEWRGSWDTEPAHVVGAQWKRMTLSGLQQATR